MSGMPKPCSRHGAAADCVGGQSIAGEEDRIAVLEDAHDLTVAGAARFSNNKNVLSAYGELGLEYYKRTGNLAYCDEALGLLKAAEEKLGDPQNDLSDELLLEQESALG